MNYHHRRLVVDAALIGTVGVTAVSVYVFQNAQVLGHDWSELAHGFVHHVSHWLVDVSGAEICAGVFYRILAIAE